MGKYDTVSVKEGSCDEFYEESERSEKAGMLLIFFVWALIFNPGYMLFCLGGINKFIPVFLTKLGDGNAGLIYQLIEGLKYIFIAGGFYISYRLYKFKGNAIKWAKLYLFIQGMVVVAVLFFYMSLLLNAYDKGMFPLTRMNTSVVLFVGSRQPMIEISHLLRSWSCDMIAALVIFGAGFAYLSMGKKLKEAFAVKELTD